MPRNHDTENRFSLKELREMKLSTVLPLYIAHLEESRPRSTGITYGCGIRAYLRSLPESSVTSDMTPKSVRRFLLAYAETHNSNSARLYLFALRDFCRWLREEGYILDDPTSGIATPKHSPPRRDIREDSVYLALWQACERLPRHYKPERARCVLALLLFAGIRRSELLSLDVADVDTRLNEIHIRHGKGNKYRRVEIAPVVTDAVIDYLHTRPKTDCKRLLMHNAKHPMGVGALYEVLDAVASVAGIEGKIRPHDLRHGYASRMIRQGCDLATVRDLLGHSSLMVTDVYVHSQEDSRRRAAEVAVFASDAPEKRERPSRVVREVVRRK